MNEQQLAQDGHVHAYANDGPRCEGCSRPLGAPPWQLGGDPRCEACAGAPPSAPSFTKALLAGGAVALGCGIVYAIFVAATEVQLSLLTIGIGWAVGRAVQRASRGLGTRRHQVLAVALTYCAASMGYLPAVLAGLASGATAPATQVVAAAPSAAPAAPEMATAEEPASTAASADVAPPSVAGFFASIAVLAALTGVLTLAAPFLDLASGLGGVMGLLIVFFGLRMAWRASTAVMEPGQSSLS